MDVAPLLAPQLEQVWARLDLVMDPELDEPLTDMGFIEAVAVTGPGIVAVSFRLPTYWCSPNFAFLMAEGIKRQVEALPWVTEAVVTLEDHMAAAEMNAAIKAGASFGTVFADLQPDEDLRALREKFDQKAFQRRQEVVIKALRDQGMPVDQIVALPRAALEAAVFGDPDAVRQQGRYLALLQSRGLAPRPQDPAFTEWSGTPLTAEGFAAYMGLLRSVRINMEFSGSLCRGLKQSRYKEADLSGAVPVLVDFARPHSERHDTPHACR
ncbi:MAG: iron-sulfur cluster assembly protein [Gemmobacter sp.]